MARNVLTAALLAFIGVSLAAAVAQVAGLRGPTAAVAPAPPPAAGERVLAYYFHTATRCPTCRAIERQAHEAVAGDAAAGSVDWRVVNYEEPAQQHFATTFQLTCPSVVLVHTRDGAVVRWKNLERVWELCDEPAEFVAYVRGELVAFREGQP